MRPRSTSIQELMIRDTVTAGSETTLTACARLMRQQHVGSIIVVESDGGGRRMPLGILTDRDIVIEAVALQLDTDTLTAGDIMSTPLSTVRQDDDLLDAWARMRECGARRLVVVDDAGALCGILALDNTLEALNEQFDSVIRVIKAERTREAETRR